MESLYEAGWRQGSILEADLPLDAVVLDETSGQPVRREGRHGRWVVASQNCDLDFTDCNDDEPSVELRPVFTDDLPDNWGIRSSSFRLTDTEYIRSTSPRPVLSPAVLTSLLASGTSRRDPATRRELP